jgi:membrane protein DedA with SNARE-associated domain
MLLIPAAGMSNMPFRKFMAYSAVGTIIWTAFLAYIGYHFGENPALISAITQRIGYIILFITMIYILYYLVKKFYLLKK